MTPELLDKVAWIGDAFVAGSVRGLVLRFQGLGGNGGMKRDADSYGLEWGAAGGLVVAPYHNPWAWMADDTVAFVDEVVDARLRDLPRDGGLRRRWAQTAGVSLAGTT